MFTGLVEEVGTVRETRPRGGGAELVIEADRTLKETKRGDSIAVNGCCLTVEAMSAKRFAAFASSETLLRSTLVELKPGSPVNLERALRLGDRLGGHLVQGHVDGVGRVASLQRDGQAWTLACDLPGELRRQVVYKGSIAIHGVSLTVAALTPSGATVAIIPETYEATSLRSLKAGDRVNIETDIIGKYVRNAVESILAAGPAGEGAEGDAGAAPKLDATASSITEELLRRSGFA